MKLAVIGLGYVGLPLAVAFAKQKIIVYGIDKDGKKIKALKKKKSYIGDVSEEDVREVINSGYLYATNDYSELANSNAVIICVPTPLRKSREPDISPLMH